MPELGELRKGTEIGFKYERYMVWASCEECGKERWVQYVNKKPKASLCLRCSNKHKYKGSGVESPTWKGGRYVDDKGYVRVWISPDDPYYCMAVHKCGTDRNGYVTEHRLMMARFLGRPLLATEEVHHKNGIRTDNRIENLEIVAKGEHTLKHRQGYQDGFKQGYKDGQTQQIKELKTENIGLKEKLLLYENIDRNYRDILKGIKLLELKMKILNHEELNSE
jgi:hypothetical protein